MAATFRVRDAQGNIYGPADADTIRQWIREGRIVPGMNVLQEGGTEWNEITSNINFADLFSQPAAAAPAQGAVAPNPYAAAPNPYATGGAPTGSQYPTYTGPQMNVLGLIGMITGIVSILACCCYGIPTLILGPASIVLSAIALKQFKAEPERYSGRNMAVAGLWCGISSLVVGVLVLIAFIIFVVMNQH